MGEGQGCAKRASRVGGSAHSPSAQTPHKCGQGTPPLGHVVAQGYAAQPGVALVPRKRQGRQRHRQRQLKGQGRRTTADALALLALLFLEVHLPRAPVRLEPGHEHQPAVR